MNLKEASETLKRAEKVYSENEGQVDPGVGPTLKELQDNLPWGDSYSQEFQDNKQSHRDWNHAVLHVIKAAGKLAALGEELDHRENNPHLGHEETAAVHALADLVICSLRLANVFPVRPIDLESAVLTRLKEKNPEYKGVKDA